MAEHSDHTTRPRTRWPPLVLIADDLTGACDAAVAFTPVAAPVRVHLGREFSLADGVSALSTDSRDLPPQVSETRLAELAAGVPPGCAIFKKIDSVLRGNTFVEIAAAIRSFPADLVLLAPAYPDLGRRVRNGILHIERAGTANTLPIDAALREHGCSPRTLHASTDSHAQAQQMRLALSAGHTLLLCDAWEQPDLEALTTAAESLPITNLWIGSGGLAHALAEQRPRIRQSSEPELPPGHTIFFIGSDHPATRAQQNQLQRMSNAGDHLLRVPPNCTTEAILRATAHLHPRNIACLFMTGGDTASLVCSALGITSLRLLREFAPGVPLAVAEGGSFHGVSVILKSGGFGDRDLLCRILDSFAGKDRVHA